jgi:hypothetical protein
MSHVTLIIDSILLLGIIGLSLYGGARLPAGAELPMHFGPAGYGRWVPKNVALVLWPAIAAAIYVVLALSARSQQASGSHSLSFGLTVALALMLVNHAGALWIAISRRLPPSAIRRHDVPIRRQCGVGTPRGLVLHGCGCDDSH